MTEWTAKNLLDLGFKDVGRWVQAPIEGQLAHILDGPNPKADEELLDARNSLYAFAQGDEIKYIGKTARTVRQRFVSYRRPAQRQRTSWRNNLNIRTALGAGISIRILVFNPIALLRYGDFKINLAAGLEDSLIEIFNPSWNGGRRGQAALEEAEFEGVDEGDDLPDAELILNTKEAPAAHEVTLPGNAALRNEFQDDGSLARNKLPDA